jgi:HlyD family secretion protein
MTQKSWSKIKPRSPSQSANQFDDAPPVPSGWLSGSRGLMIGVGIGVAIAVVGLRLLPQASTPSAETPTPAPEAAASQTVTTSRVQEVPIDQTLKATGTVAAVDLLPVAPQAPGLQVQQVLAAEGDRVQAGQALAVLDDSVLQAQIAQAEAQVEAARAAVQQRRAALSQAEANRNDAQRNLERYRMLATEGAISQETLDARSTAAITAQESVGLAQADIASAEANVRSATASVDQLRSQLGQTVVRAPASGIIAERSAQVGDVSATSQPLFSIIRNDLLELEVKVPQTDLAQVNVGAPVQITSTSDSQIQLQGRVREIMPLVDAETREATVKIDLPASSLLRPGMFLTAEIVTAQQRGFAVPAAAVMAQGSESFVYVLTADNVAEQRSVELGARLPASESDGADFDAALVEIRSGLDLGDRVVVRGAGYVQPGDRVRVVEDAE